MPAKSPQPTPGKGLEDETLARARTKTPAFNTVASMRKSLIMPSPEGTAATEAMTPMSVSPEPPDSISFRSSRDLDDGRQSPDDDVGTPSEWRVRALFIGDKVHRRARSFQESGTPVPPLPPRSSLGSHAESESSVPTMRKSSRRRKSRSCNSKSMDNEDWTTNDFGMSERRRSSSASLTNIVSPDAKNPSVDTTSSSSENSPEVSPSRQNSLNRQRRSSFRVISPVPDEEVTGLKACLRVGRLRTNKLIFILFLVGFLSLGFTVITNRAVIQVGEVIGKGELEEAMTRYERMNDSAHVRPKNPPAGGLRGSLVKTVGGNRHKHHDHKKDDKKGDHGKDDHGKHEKNDGHEKDVKKETATVKKEDDKKVAEQKATKPSASSKPAKENAATSKNLAIAVPTKKLKIKQSFNSVDHKMFDPDAKSKTESARVMYLHDSIIEKAGPISRHVQVYPSDFTDNTQLYGVLDSGDERLSKMELRDPYSDEHCVPMQDWQITFHPSCNGMHEMALDHMGDDVDNDFHLFGTKGFWRNAWKVDILGDNHRSEDRETVVLKTLK